MLIEKTSHSFHNHEYLLLINATTELVCSIRPVSVHIITIEAENVREILSRQKLEHSILFQFA